MDKLTSEYNLDLNIENFPHIRLKEGDCNDCKPKSKLKRKDSLHSNIQKIKNKFNIGKIPKKKFVLINDGGALKSSVLISNN